VPNLFFIPERVSVFRLLSPLVPISVVLTINYLTALISLQTSPVQMHARHCFVLETTNNRTDEKNGANMSVCSEVYTEIMQEYSPMCNWCIPGHVLPLSVLDSLAIHDRHALFSSHLLLAFFCLCTTVCCVSSCLVSKTNLGDQRPQMHLKLDGAGKRSVTAESKEDRKESNRPIIQTQPQTPRSNPHTPRTTGAMYSPRSEELTPRSCGLAENAR
jgi:hypothetical protein